MTDTAVGASTCAQGNHVWNGQIGTLIAKPMKRPIQKILSSGDVQPKSSIVLPANGCVTPA